MDPSHHALAPSGPFSPTSRQSKMVSQRQYRANEGECFNTLRELINKLTGEELQTRQEILRKAIDLLLVASEIRKSRETRAIRPTPCATRASANEGPMASTHMGRPAESSRWHSIATFNVQSPYYVFQSHGQHYFNMDPLVNRASSRGHDQD